MSPRSGFGLGAATPTMVAEQRAAGAVTKLLLRDNNLKPASIVPLFASVDAASLQSLDLSMNTLGRLGGVRVAAGLESAASLAVLVLERCSLGDSGGAAVVNALSHCPRLRRLLLPRNNLAHASGRALGKLVKEAKALLLLDVSWNKLSGDGAVRFCKGLQHSTSLETLDMSWNGFGASPDAAVSKALRAALASNSTLVHVDMRINNFTETDRMHLARGLAHNHTLLGLHAGGSGRGVDPRGFITSSDKDAFKSNPEELHTAVFTRIVGLRTQGSEEWGEKDNCWICEKWRESK